MVKLSRDIYMENAVEAGRRLIGCTLVSCNGEGTVSGRIVETEAYMGRADTASHASRGDPAGRTRILYKEGGFAYVYLIYGIYCCLNISVGPEGVPQCVLIRALEPIEGIELMRHRRKTTAIKSLCSGPGKLCQALDITLEEYGCDLAGSRLYILDRPSEPDIAASERINIDYAAGYKDKPWRFTEKGSPFVSVRLK